MLAIKIQRCGGNRYCWDKILLKVKDKVSSVTCNKKKKGASNKRLHPSCFVFMYFYIMKHFSGSCSIHSKIKDLKFDFLAPFGHFSQKIVKI